MIYFTSDSSPPDNSPVTPAPQRTGSVRLVCVGPARPSRVYNNCRDDRDSGGDPRQGRFCHDPGILALAFIQKVHHFGSSFMSLGGCHLLHFLSLKRKISVCCFNNVIKIISNTFRNSSFLERGVSDIATSQQVSRALYLVGGKPIRCRLKSPSHPSGGGMNHSLSCESLSSSPRRAARTSSLPDAAAEGAAAHSGVSQLVWSVQLEFKPLGLQ